MTTEERAREIVSVVLDMCGVTVENRPQLEQFVIGHLDAIERTAAEKAIGVYRAKLAEASDTVSAQTAIGAPGGTTARSEQ
jgi:hypothetical protein